VDNQESVNLIVNAPNVENIPSNELNTLPYVFPPDIGPGPDLPPNKPPIPLI